MITGCSGVGGSGTCAFAEGGRDATGPGLAAVAGPEDREGHEPRNVGPRAAKRVKELGCPWSLEPPKGARSGDPPEFGPVRTIQVSDPGIVQ